MSDIRVIISDVDGCITPEASRTWISPAMTKFVRLCRTASAGKGSYPPITLCTGRPQPYVEAMMKMMDIRLPAICENGAVIYTLHDNRARYGPGVTREKIDALKEVRDFIEYDLLPKHRDCLLQFGKVAQVSVFSEKRESLAKLVPPIEKFVDALGKIELEIIPSVHYLNISMSGVDKGRATEELLKEINCHMEEAAGIGDTDGDLPLRDAVDFFACPANASPELMMRADYRSGKKEITGVLDCLKAIRQENKSRQRE